MKKFSWIFVLVSSLISLFTYPLLPDRVPTHWNIQGEVDQYAPKAWSSLFFPVIVLGLLLTFSLLPKLDPNKDKYHLFYPEWRVIQNGILAFFVYLQAVTTYTALNPQQDILPLVLLGLGTLFVVLGNYLSKIRQNYFLGIKLPWTIANEDNWNKTHRFASWCFVLVGLILLVEAVIQWQVQRVVVMSVAVAVLAPSLYSYWLFRQGE